MGYGFANPDANLDDLRNALREVGSQFSQLMGAEERDDYDDIEGLCDQAFDQIFVDVNRTPRRDAYLYQTKGAPVLRVEDRIYPQRLQPADARPGARPAHHRRPHPAHRYLPAPRLR